MIIGIAGCLAATGCAVDGYVTEQPAEVVYERGVAPGPDYIWIDGDWVWGGGGYRWRNGYWGHPRGERAWERGHWDHNERGYHWNRGHWR